jgi:heme oxygenase (mycobilin-producing)
VITHRASARAVLGEVQEDGGMTFVAVNVLTVPEGAGATLEQRFARRAGSVERAPGFEHFELLRPLEGTDSYLVYTRWSSREAFEEWTRSQSFAAGHGQASGRGQSERPAATGSTIWSFEVVQAADPA